MKFFAADKNVSLMYDFQLAVMRLFIKILQVPQYKLSSPTPRQLTELRMETKMRRQQTTGTYGTVQL